MAEIVILTEQNIDRFKYDQELGAYTRGTLVEYALKPDCTYRVVWDGNSYQCTAYVVAESPRVWLGNKAFISGESQAVVEPFVISYADGINNLYMSLDTKDTHSVAIFQIVEENETEDSNEGIVLKDRNGKDVAYYDIETVTFDTTTPGKQQTYSKGVVAPRMEIPVTFADGDMPITADKNTLIKELVLQKPDTLKPENIAEGIDIAGIIGTMAAGSSVKIAAGLFTGDGTAKTIQHGLGVVPDIVIVYSTTTTSAPQSTYYTLYCAFSSALHSALCSAGSIGTASMMGALYANRFTSGSSNNGYLGGAGYNIDNQTNRFVNSATADSFVIGTASTPPYNGYDHIWIAIGGLTE